MSEALLRTAFRLTAILAAALGFAYMLVSNLDLSDDHLWLYSTAYTVDRADTLDAVKTVIGEGLEEIGAGEKVLYRFALRDGGEDHYRFTSWMGYLARGMTAPMPPFDDAASGEVAKTVILHRLAITFTLTFLVALALFAFGVFRISDMVVLGAVATVMVGVALVDILPIPSRAMAFNHPFWLAFTPDEGATRLGQMFRHTIKFMLHPGPQFSAYALPPKNQFQLVLIAIFALRWADRRMLAYALLAVACVLHHPYAAFMALFIAIFDAWWQPHWLLRPWPMVLIAVPVLGNMVRFDLGHSDWGLTFWGPAILLGLILIAAAVQKARLGRRPETGPWLSERPAALQDLLAFWVLWLISALAFGVIAQSAPELEAQYFWGNIHSRLMGLMLLPTYVGVAMLAAYGVARVLPSWRTRGASLLALVLVLGVAGLTGRLVVAKPWSAFPMSSPIEVVPQVCDLDAEGRRFEGIEVQYFIHMIDSVESGGTERAARFMAPCGN